MAKKSTFLISRRDKVSQTDDAIVESEGITIGRLISNDLALNHRAVSRVHAGIKELHGEFWVFNLSGSNGTLLNGQLVTKSPLATGDIVQIGPYLLHITYIDRGLAIVVEMELEIRPLEARTTAGRLPSQDSLDGTLLIDLPRAASKGASGGTKIAQTGLLSALLPALDEKALSAFWDKRKREAGKIDARTPLHPVTRQKTGKAQYNWRPTLDLKRMWRASYFFWAVILVTGGAIAAVYFYTDAYSPGPLTIAHASADQPSRPIAARPNASCSECHTPSRPMAESCANCHSTPQFSPAVYDAHSREGMSCFSCHSEHQGRDTEQGLISYALCSSCHNDQYKVKTGPRSGQALGTPHGGTVGYPAENGGWRKWQGFTAEQWKRKGFSEDLAKRTPSQQFHAVHQEGRMADRMRCKDCHSAGSPRDALWRSSPAGECAKCHTLASTIEGPILLQANCNTCHQQHGSSRDLARLIPAATVENKKIKDYLAKLDLTGAHDSEAALATGRLFLGTGGASQIRQDRFSLTTSPPSQVGGLPWYVWLLVVSGFAVIGVAVAVRGTIRTRKALLSDAQKPPKYHTTRIPTGSIDIEKLEKEGPPFPHPAIDPLLCIGCHACVEACPHDVLAIVNGIASPVAIDQCMEDTSCQVECPTNPKACIVINTTKVIPLRKAPERDRRFKTNIEGIFLIGDVSGVPLIKNAINEGAQVIDYIVEDLQRKPGAPADYDVAIIGIGPAGLSATALARQRRLRYLALEQDKVVSTIDNYPAGKYIFFKPDSVDARGPIPLPGLGEIKETILQSWARTIRENRLEINEEECCTSIKSENGSFRIQTEKGKAKEKMSYTARSVILAIGNRGTPMRLKVPGEDLKILAKPKTRLPENCPNCSKPRKFGQYFCVWCGTKFDVLRAEPYLDDRVKYKLSDPDDFENKKCIIVGAGNSAIEAAVDLCGFRRIGDQITFTRNNEVTLVIRSDFKGDLKLGNKMNVYDCIDAGRIKVFFRTEIKEIREGEVILMDVRTKEERARLQNDYVFALIGGERPTKFLESMGIKVG